MGESSQKDSGGRVRGGVLLCTAGLAGRRTKTCWRTSGRARAVDDVTVLDKRRHRRRVAQCRSTPSSSLPFKKTLAILPAGRAYSMRFASGARLGPFEILSPIGAGGMGEVYRARDTRLDRTVAIKLLPSELLNASGRRIERFRREARAIARITHPHICTLHDIGEDGPAIFLVMEYVDGVTLARRLEDGPLPLAVALLAAAQIADALDHAHRQGVVHADLKPGNIMLTRDGVKLLDFGLAKLRERDEEASIDATKSARLTELGSIAGTVPYMAPEQIEGREVDGRTDIFAFGVVLFEMLCGRRPFGGESRASLMAAIVAAEPPALSSLQPRAPASLERLIQRCLAKDPEVRWQTARDMAASCGGSRRPARKPRRQRQSKRAGRSTSRSGAASRGLG